MERFLTQQTISTTSIVLLAIAATLFTITIGMMKLQKLLTPTIFTYIITIFFAVTTAIFFIIVGFGFIYTNNSFESMRDQYNININNNALKLTLKDNRSLLVKTFYDEQITFKITQDEDFIILNNTKTNELKEFSKEEFNDVINKLKTK